MSFSFDNSLRMTIGKQVDNTAVKVTKDILSKNTSTVSSKATK